MSRHAAIVLVGALVAGLVGVVLVVHLWPWRETARAGFGRDVIRIGYAVEPPYAYVTPEGEVTGESPELARQVVRRLGAGRTVWVQTSFPSLMSDLEAGRFDVIAAGLFVNAERARRVLFSVPTFRVRPGLLVQNGNPRGIHSYRDAARMPDTRIAVLSGAVEERILLAEGLPRARLLPVPDARTGWVAVASSAADALALSLPSLRWMVRSQDQARVEVADPFEQPADSVTGRTGYGAFAFRRGDERLRDAWDSVLRSYVGSDEHLRLVAPYGFTKDEMPGRVSVAELVRP